VAVQSEGVWSQSVTTRTAHHIPNTLHPTAPTVMVQAGYLVSKPWVFTERFRFILHLSAQNGL